MSLTRPAVQALPVKSSSNPGDDWWSDEVLYSPSAGLAHPKLYYDEGALPLLTTSTPVQTTSSTTDSSAPSIGDPTPTTVAQASTSMVNMLAPEGLSFTDPVLDSAFPAATNSSDITTSSSSSQPPSPSLTSTTTSPVPSTTPQELSSPPIPNVVFGSTTIPSMTPTSPADAFVAGSTSGAKKSGLSGGAIAAIVIVLVIVMCAIAFFILRNRQIKRRVARRVTWTAGLSPRLDMVSSSLEKGVGDTQHPVSSDAPTAGPSQSPTSGPDGNRGGQAPFRNIPRKPPIPYSPVTPTMPPQSYNNPPNPPATSIHSANSPTVASASEEPVPTTVRVRFVPQLPDELAITAGETLYIQREFDDGWALCINTVGKQGMVPLECLEGGGGQLARVPPVGDWGTTRRASSLTVATWT
ncbi:hypothetical protein BC827DRAFT_1176651 [Russula dissimulans]|nr:hypothetical protein BC827DRAFT_1176651 [Russula dissimulans]